MLFTNEKNFAEGVQRAQSVREHWAGVAAKPTSACPHALSGSSEGFVGQNQPQTIMTVFGGYFVMMVFDDTFQHQLAPVSIL